MISILVFLYGTILGSFLNVCIYRIPRGESIIRPRSHCPHCKRQLKAWENIPIVSYVLLKGRCSSCNSPISLRYPLVEILTAAVLVVLYHRFGLSFDFLVFAFFLGIVIVITFIDFDLQLIPNRLLLIGLIPAVYPLLRDGLSSIQKYLIGGGGLGLGILLIGLMGNLVFKRESMGMGDVKYAALIGLILGWREGLVAVSVAFLAASILLVFLMPFGKVSVGQRIPFGPFLSLGVLLALIWGPDIIKGYLELVF